MRNAVLACLALSLVACDGDGEEPVDAGLDDAGTSGPVAVLEVPDGDEPIGWLDAPYPNDLYLGSEGTIELGTVPAPGPLWRATVEALRERAGFCRTCAIHFRIAGGDVDAATLEGNVRIMRADGDGGFLDADPEYSAVDETVNVRPANEVVLAPGTAYIVALTDGIASSDGTPLSASPQHLAARDGSGSARVSAVLEPAFVALEGAGVARDTVLAVAAFTTAETGEHLQQLAAIADAAPTPTATVDRVFLATDGTLDALLGTPEAEIPGNDVTPMAGTEGDRSIAHGNIAAVVIGSFEAPRIVSGGGTENGLLLTDASGALMAGAQQEVPYALVIPNGADLSNLPVAIAHTGQPGSRVQAVFVGNTLAGAGIATISISTYLNGERADISADNNHNFRGGDLGPDGFAEWDTGRTFTQFQGLSGSEEVGLHPGYVHGASSQIVADGIQLLRFVEEGDVSAIADADASLAGLALDDANTFWLGLSFGSLTGMNVVAARAGVEAAVFNVGPSGLHQTICQGGTRGAVGALTGLLGIEGDFDGQTRRFCHHPNISLLNTFYELTAPVNAMHYIFREPVVSGTPHILFQYSDADETIGQAAAEQVLNDTGVPVAGDVTYIFSEPNEGTPPFSGNVTTPNGTITAGGWMFTSADHVFLIRRNGLSEYETPYRFPFVERASPLMFDNPIDACHAQIGAFLGGALDGGTPTIDAPALP